MVLVILGLIAYSTTSKALPWFRKEGLGAVFSDNWDPAHNHFGALCAVLRHVPRGLPRAADRGADQHRHRAVRHRDRAAPTAKPVIYIVDLLAAIPSVVYGLWAIFVLFDPLANLYADVRRPPATSRS